jgi:hypothetical protein
VTEDLNEEFVRQWDLNAMVKRVLEPPPRSEGTAEVTLLKSQMITCSYLELSQAKIAVEVMALDDESSIANSYADAPQPAADPNINCNQQPMSIGGVLLQRGVSLVTSFLPLLPSSSPGIGAGRTAGEKSLLAMFASNQKRKKHITVLPSKQKEKDENMSVLSEEERYKLGMQRLMDLLEVHVYVPCATIHCNNLALQLSQYHYCLIFGMSQCYLDRYAVFNDK